MLIESFLHRNKTQKKQGMDLKGMSLKQYRAHSLEN